MSKNSVQQARMALAGAKEFVMAKEARSSVPLMADSPELRASKRALDQFVSPSLATAGLEPRRLAELQEQHRTSLLRSIEQQKADAERRSTKAIEALERDAARRVEASEELIKHHAVGDPTRYDFLNLPFMIWPTKGLEVYQDTIEPSNSKAKVTWNYSSSDWNGKTDDLSFYYMWTNPSDRYTVINVDAYMIASGFCSIISGSSVISPISATYLTVTAQLNILEWWNQPPTTPFVSQDQYAQVLSLEARPGIFSGNSASGAIFRGYDLRHTVLSVPPQAVVIFDVSLVISGSTEEGSASADFSSGNFYIGCPGVLVATLT